MAFIKTSKPVKGGDEKTIFAIATTKKNQLSRSTLNESMHKTYMKNTLKYHKNLQVQP